MTRELLRLEYIPLDRAVLWDTNPKKHDIPQIIDSIKKHGYKDPAKFEPELNGGGGGLAEGNGRTVALKTMRDRGEQPPPGVDVTMDGQWAVPVLFGVDAQSEAAAEAYAIDHNNLTLGGGGFTSMDKAMLWDAEYENVLARLAKEDELPVSVSEDDLHTLTGMVPTRPDFSGLVEKLTPQETGKAKGDENWFYIEYYGDTARWESLLELLEPHFTSGSKHELKPDLFYDMVMAYFGENDGVR